MNTQGQFRTISLASLAGQTGVARVWPTVSSPALAGSYTRAFSNEKAWVRGYCLYAVDTLINPSSWLDFATWIV